MSEPTYLIRVTHNPTEVMLPYEARVTRIADDSHAITRWGTSAEEAVKAAQEWMRAEYGEREPEREFRATENGELLIGESVRVLRQP